MRTGLVLKIISNLCYVKSNSEIFKCKTKGNLKFNNQSPITGDIVDFEIVEEILKEGMIFNINERKNEIYRPKIANIDRVVIISALKEPKFNSYILVKYLSLIEKLDIQPILVFTKYDLAKDDELLLHKVKEFEKLSYPILFIDNQNTSIDDFNSLKEMLKEGISVFTGQSGAGKSTTLNHLLPSVFERTQEISKALGRGKHTTTKNELFEYFDGYIADTPGFSSFELIDFKLIDVATSFSYFRKTKCKFNDCIHKMNTKGCNIVKKVIENKIPQFFYDDYIKIITELEEQEKRKKY